MFANFVSCVTVTVLIVPHHEDIVRYFSEFNIELDLESIMSSLRMDFEKEGISFRND